MMTRKTKQSKGELLKEITGSGQPERLSLAEDRDKLYEQFYNNLRLLVATETISMTGLARLTGLKSGTRIAALCYGRGNPTLEELIMLAKHFICTTDELLYKKIKIIWE